MFYYVNKSKWLWQSCQFSANRCKGQNYLYFLLCNSHYCEIWWLPRIRIFSKSGKKTANHSKVSFEWKYRTVICSYSELTVHAIGMNMLSNDNWISHLAGRHTCRPTSQYANIPRPNWLVSSMFKNVNFAQTKKWNESGFRPPLCTYRLNWARRTSWGWWDDWDDTVLQTQDSKFELRKLDTQEFGGILLLIFTYPT